MYTTSLWNLSTELVQLHSSVHFQSLFAESINLSHFWSTNWVYYWKAVNHHFFTIRRFNLFVMDLLMFHWLEALACLTRPMSGSVLLQDPIVFAHRLCMVRYLCWRFVMIRIEVEPSMWTHHSKFSSTMSLSSNPILNIITFTILVAECKKSTVKSIRVN